MNTTGTGKIGIAEFCHFVDQKPTVKRSATSKVDAFSSYACWCGGEKNTGCFAWKIEMDRR